MSNLKHYTWSSSVPWQLPGPEIWDVWAASPWPLWMKQPPEIQLWPQFFPQWSPLWSCPYSDGGGKVLYYLTNWREFCGVWVRRTDPLDIIWYLNRKDQLKSNEVDILLKLMTCFQWMNIIYIIINILKSRFHIYKDHPLSPEGSSLSNLVMYNLFVKSFACWVLSQGFIPWFTQSLTLSFYMAQPTPYSCPYYYIDALNPKPAS